LLLILLSAAVCAAPVQEYVVVVHHSRDVEALPAIDLQRMFLGKMKKWPDGSSVLPVFNSDEVVHESFTRDLLHKSTYQLNAYWRKRLYSGQGMLPYTAQSHAEILAYLVKHPNAVSYLPANEVVAPLKSVRVAR
jgi:hypothetical protein